MMLLSCYILVEEGKLEIVIWHDWLSRFGRGLMFYCSQPLEGSQDAFPQYWGLLCFPYLHTCTREYKLHKYAALTHGHSLQLYIFGFVINTKTLCNSSWTDHVAPPPPQHSTESCAFTSHCSSFKKLSRAKNRWVALPWKERRNNKVVTSVELHFIRSFRPTHHLSYVFQVVRCFSKRFRDLIPALPSPELHPAQTSTAPSFSQTF